MRKRESVILTRRQRRMVAFGAERTRFPERKQSRGGRQEQDSCRGAGGAQREKNAEEESCQFWQEPNYAGTGGRGSDGRMGAPGRVAASRAQTLTITSRSRSRVRKNLTLSKRANSFSRLRLLNNCTGRRMPC